MSHDAWRGMSSDERYGMLLSLVPSVRTMPLDPGSSQRALGSIVAILDAAYLLAESPEHPSADVARKTIASAAAAVRQTELPVQAALLLVEELSAWAAHDAKDLETEDLSDLVPRFSRLWPEHLERLDRVLALAAVEAWRLSEQRRGPRSKWRPIWDAVRSAGIEIQSPKSLSKAWFTRHQKRSWIRRDQGSSK